MTTSMAPKSIQRDACVFASTKLHMLSIKKLVAIVFCLGAQARVLPAEERRKNFPGFVRDRRWRRNFTHLPPAFETLRGPWRTFFVFILCELPIVFPREIRRARGISPVCEVRRLQCKSLAPRSFFFSFGRRRFAGIVAIFLFLLGLDCAFRAAL